MKLTLAQLANHDDILTDALVDNVYFWTDIRKNRPRYVACRALKEEQIAAIVRQHVAFKRDVKTALSEVEKLPGIKNYMVSKLKGAAEVDHFRKHLERYLQIYLPDCPFEITTTNRYTITTHEACVTARRPIKRGETIKYLAGIQVVITKDEGTQLDLTRRNFSIVFSSRKKTQSIFLGPARFANHDCDANARLNSTASNLMEVIALRSIDRGDEITVSYGDDYFGDSNRECLCATCEKYLRNGWRPIDGSEDEALNSQVQDLDTAEDDFAKYGYGLRSSQTKRRRGADSPTPSTRTVTPDYGGSLSKRRRLNMCDSTESSKALTISSSNTPQLESVSRGTSQLSQVFSVPSPDTAATPATNFSDTPLVGNSAQSEGNDISVDSDNIASTDDKVHADHVSTVNSSSQDKPVSMDEAKPTEIKADHPETDHPKTDHPKAEDLAMPSMQANAEDDTLSQNSPACLDPPPLHPKPESPQHLTLVAPTAVRPSEISLIKEMGLCEEESELSDCSAFDVDERDQQAARRCDTASVSALHKAAVSRSNSRGMKKRNMRLALSPKSLRKHVNAIGHDKGPVRRVPGDYNSHKGLLGNPQSTWNSCATCEKRWIQENGYELRACCPRCERHSKVYGFEWPKTEREGSNDTELRILDHREVNRVKSKTGKVTVYARAKKGKGSKTEKARYSGIWHNWQPLAEARK